MAAKRETAAEKRAKQEKAKSEVTVVQRTVVVFKGSGEYGSYSDYEASYSDNKDEVVITAPCGEERTFKTDALKALLEALN